MRLKQIIVGTYKRMLGALRLDERVFTEIRDDSKATYQAIAVVALAATATAIHVPGSGWLFLLLVIIRFLAWWVILAALIYLAGTWLLPAPRAQAERESQADFLQLARMIGFALTPRILRVFVIIEPFRIGEVIFYGVVFWQFAAIVVAVRLAFGYVSMTRVTLVVGIPLVPLMLLEAFLLGQL